MNSLNLSSRLTSSQSLLCLLLLACWLSFAGHALGQATVLHSFAGGPSDGFGPANSGLVQVSDGNFYGVTANGGSFNKGTLFKITPTGTTTILYNFGSIANDGVQPWASLTLGSDGLLYGTTLGGGSFGRGTAFKITTSGATYTILHSFNNNFASGDGFDPKGPLIQGSDHSFYGTTFDGGTGSDGTVFKMTSGGAVTILYSFTGAAHNDGANPQCGLVQGSDGNLYGTTNVGGSLNEGTVFKTTLAPTVTTTIIHRFNAANDGYLPYAGLIQRSDGYFYGTTGTGGVGGSGEGTVFKISSDGTTYSALHTFTGAPDGSQPEASLTQGLDGNLYGTTFFGGTGTPPSGGAGAVFSVTPTGTVATLERFTESGFSGANPWAPVIFGTDGSLYGTMLQGGISGTGAPSGFGVIFKIALPPATDTPTMPVWALVVLAVLLVFVSANSGLLKARRPTSG